MLALLFGWSVSREAITSTEIIIIIIIVIFKEVAFIKVIMDKSEVVQDTNSHDYLCHQLHTGYLSFLHLPFKRLIERSTICLHDNRTLLNLV